MIDPNNIGLVLREAKEKTQAIREGNHTILDLPTDIETLATAIYNIASVVQYLVERER
jgi:hypothetical protein